MNLWIATAAVALAGPLLWGAAKPDFTGTWKLDPLRSRLDQKTDEKDLTLKFEHHEPAIRIVISDAKSKEPGGVLELTTDGTEHTCSLHGHPAQAAVRWDESAENRLILTIRENSGASEQTVTREFRLGDKGHILTTVMRVRDAGGEKQSYEFFTKQ